MKLFKKPFAFCLCWTVAAWSSCFANEASVTSAPNTACAKWLGTWEGVWSLGNIGAARVEVLTAQPNENTGCSLSFKYFSRNNPDSPIYRAETETTDQWSSKLNYGEIFVTYQTNQGQPYLDMRHIGRGSNHAVFQKTN